MASKPASQVLTLPDLVTLILAYLDELSDIESAQRVNRAWSCAVLRQVRGWFAENVGSIGLLFLQDEEGCRRSERMAAFTSLVRTDISLPGFNSGFSTIRITVTFGPSDIKLPSRSTTLGVNYHDDYLKEVRSIHHCWLLNYYVPHETRAIFETFRQLKHITRKTMEDFATFLKRRISTGGDNLAVEDRAENRAEWMNQAMELKEKMRRELLTEGGHRDIVVICLELAKALEAGIQAVLGGADDMMDEARASTREAYETLVGIGTGMGPLEHSLPTSSYDEYGPIRKRFDFRVTHPSTNPSCSAGPIPLPASDLEFEYTHHQVSPKGTDKSRKRPSLELDARWMVFNDFDEMEDFPEGGVVCAGIRITCSLSGWVKLMGLRV